MPTAPSTASTSVPAARPAPASTTGGRSGRGVAAEHEVRRGADHRDQRPQHAERSEVGARQAGRARARGRARRARLRPRSADRGARRGAATATRPRRRARCTRSATRARRPSARPRRSRRTARPARAPRRTAATGRRARAARPSVRAARGRRAAPRPARRWPAGPARRPRATSRCRAIRGRTSPRARTPLQRRPRRSVPSASCHWPYPAWPMTVTCKIRVVCP